MYESLMAPVGAPIPLPGERGLRDAALERLAAHQSLLQNVAPLAAPEPAPEPKRDMVKCMACGYTYFKKIRHHIGGAFFWRRHSLHLWCAACGARQKYALGMVEIVSGNSGTWWTLAWREE